MAPPIVTEPLTGDDEDHLKMLQEALDSVQVQFDGLDLRRDPHPQSSMSTDDRRLGGYPMSYFVASSLSASAGNLQTLRTLVSIGSLNGKPVVQGGAFGPLSVTRSAIEAAAQALWVMLPRSRPERIARRLALRLDELRVMKATIYDGALGAAREDAHDPIKHDDLPPGVQADLKKVTDTRIKALELARMASPNSSLGMVKRASDKTSWTSILKDIEEAYPIMQEYRLRARWRIVAGVSHGKEWATLATSDLRAVERTDKGDGAYYSVTMNYESLNTAGLTAVYLLREAINLYILRVNSHR